MLGAKQVSVSNHLLGALPRKDYQKLLPILEPVKLVFGETLYESQAQIRHVYFPVDCFVSMLTTVDAGRAAEVGLIGSEGMIGVPMALGVAFSPFRAVVQGGGTALRLKTVDFRRNFSDSAALQREVFLFTHLLMIQIAQTAACNRLHDIQQRLSRWLLMTQDRVHSGVLPITHDFVATMMGTDRSTVSLAASVLQKKGILEYVRGAVKIVNRRKLEKSACECYDVIRQFEDELGLR